MTPPVFKPVADHAVLVTFGTEIAEDTHRAVLALDRALMADPPEGMIETVPALVNLLVDFGPLVTDHAAITSDISERLTGLRIETVTGQERVVQVCYDAALAPDLAAVAKATGLSREAVIAAHLSGDYRVLMYGFVPGYAYLGGVPAPIRVPRKPSPVRDIPAGSLLIAGPQCLVTSLTMPTGWSVIGRSPTRIMTRNEARPFFFDVGDTVRFERIDRADFDRLTRESAHG